MRRRGSVIKPIETTYRGCRFRSRLEARWAVFFDALEIKWEYEFQGFELSDGSFYLPDFRLPTFHGGVWAEVKPHGGDFSKARLLAFDSGDGVWLCEGTPDVRAYMIVERVFEWPEKKDTAEWVGIPNVDQARGEDRMYSCPGYENDDLSIPERYQDPRYVAAVNAARGERF